MKNLYLILLYLLPCICLSQDKIYYNILKTELGQDKLILTVGGNDFIVEEGGCLEIDSVIDLNNDGYNDVILIIDKNCYTGKIHSYPSRSYKIVTYDGIRYHQTKTIGHSVSDFKVYDSSFGYYFEIKNSYWGGEDFCQDKSELYRLNNHTLDLVSKVSENIIPTIIEVNTKDLSDFLYENNYMGVNYSYNPSFENIYIKYDLNNDNHVDSISTSHSVGERRVLLSPYIHIKNGPDISVPGGKRIGVLSSITNGFHDLVIDCDEILIWNGTEYIRK